MSRIIRVQSQNYILNKLVLIPSNIKHW